MHFPVLTFFSFFLLFLALFPCFYLGIKVTYMKLIETCILVFPWLMLHELLHGFSYMIHGAKWRNITYGICLEKSILYCLCKQNISKKNILWSLFFPFFWIGIVTYILGILFGNVTLILLSILNISGCAADLVMFFFLLKLKNIEFSEFDNPFAFAIYTAEDVSNKKTFGLRFVEKRNVLEKNDLKKFQISTKSVWILIGIFFLFCYLLF